jgi:hypothetical protein
MMKCIYENEIFETYKKLGLVAISIDLQMNKETGKKIFTPPFKWQEIKKTTINKDKHNGVMIRNKTKLSDGSYLFVIDLDTTKNKDGISGIDFWNEYIKKTNTKIDTFRQRTGNDGIHFLFRTFNEKLYNASHILGLTIDGVKQQIDIPNAIISEPSHYGNGEIHKYYKFGKITNDINDIQILPESITDLILKHSNTVKKYENEDVIEKDLIIVNPNYPLLNILESHFESYSEWSRMCWIMKSLNYPFSVFDEFSKKYPSKYNYNDCFNYWNKCKTSKINEGILHTLARGVNPLEYEKLNLSINYKPDVIPVETIQITKDQINKNDGYLIHKDNNDLDFKDCLISNKLKEFFTSDIKSFNIKSPYDTGKTQLLTKIFKKYKQERILFLSYRKTLTSDLMYSFDDFGFKDYRDANCKETNKLIIQLESINKIKPSFLFVDEEFEIPKYDLVIIDEVESILQQFNSETFKGESKSAFEFINAIIKNSNKLITLDGDLSFRGFNYIKNFGSSINIINPVKKNQRNFYIIDNENIFHSNIECALNDKKKIVIVSQTSSMCDSLFVFIKQKYKDIKMAVYTGSTNDKDKTELSNVLKNWVELDVLIYSPTIESGVNFDLPHFDKIFGVVSSGCNSQRAFCQMLSRVRKITDNNITILASRLNYVELKKSNIYTFDEVQNALITLGIIKVNETIEGSKMVKRLSSYDINFCYNKIEELMKNKFYYLGYLVHLLKNKGHQVTNLIEPKKKDDKKNKVELSEDIINSKCKNSELLSIVDDITEDKFKFLLEKQKQSTADKVDKLQIKKFVIKASLGVDKMDEKILGYYDSPFIIRNIEHLIDKTNIKQYNDNQTKETIKKVEIINDLITKLGFKLFDGKMISRENFEKNVEEIMKTNELFINPKLVKVLFNSSKVGIKTNRQFLGFVNSILENYKLKIKSDEIRVKKEDIEKIGKTKDTAYSLQFIDGYETINELIQYKINKGYKLNDTNNIRPTVKTNKYGYLILSDEEKQKYYDELDEKEMSKYYSKNNNVVNDEFIFPDPYGLDIGL